MRTVNIFDLREWNKLVIETYNKPYSFQQQDGCKDRGIEYFSVPIGHPEDYENDTVPEIINGEEMGVSFKAWLARDSSKDSQQLRGLWWERNFYPHLEIIAQDLYNRGLLTSGNYAIAVDW